MIQDAVTYSLVMTTNSDVVKIDKIFGFIHSHIKYQTRLLDHMWFPTETITFKSGDCTSFSILAACMFEKVGIKSAIGFFTNDTLGRHAIVLVRLDNLGGYPYR
ncbi:MAG: transglutaminase domain-containing protein [Candidatus Bathyarchaeia archaeon]